MRNARFGIVHFGIMQFVSRKAETELCQTFQTEIQEKLGIPMLGSASRFSEVNHTILMTFSVSEKINHNLYVPEESFFWRIFISSVSIWQ